MKHFYIDRDTRSIIDLSPPGFPPHYGWTINRVSVLPPHRGKGLARKLMNQVLSDADRTQNNLWLDVAPSRDYHGTLSWQQLFDFYWRCGFRPAEEFPTMMRAPYRPPAWTIDQAISQLGDLSE